MQLLGALLAAALWRRRTGDARRARWVFAGGLALLAGTSWLASRLSGGGLADYSHVVEFLLAKLARLGRMPEDPAELSFGTLLLWQGPFATAPPEVFTYGLTVGIPVLAWGLWAAAPGWLRGRRDDGLPVLVALTALSFLATWMVVRVQILPGLLVPVLAAVLLARVASRRTALALAAVALVVQAGLVQRFVLAQDVDWYVQPAGPGRIAEREQMIAWIDQNVPAGEAVVADFLNSAAIVAFTGRPVVQQPKYETARSRDRIEAFFRALFQGTPRDLHALALSWRSRWLVVDRPWLANNCTLGGVPMREFFQRGARPGTAASFLIHPDPNVYGRVPGFRLRYQTTSTGGFPSFAIYQLMPPQRAPR
jgi:hypothetical protein